MKTIEDRAREICENLTINDPSPIEVSSVAALIRADREALLKRVEEDFHSILWGAVGANPKMINPICDYVLAAAEERGRREAEAKFWPIFMWLLGYTDWPERKPGEGAFYWRTKLRRDLENTITDFAALLAEGKKEGEDDNEHRR